jgi:hypothetical protein
MMLARRTQKHGSFSPLFFVFSLKVSTTNPPEKTIADPKHQPSHPNQPEILDKEPFVTTHNYVFISPFCFAYTYAYAYLMSYFPSTTAAPTPQPCPQVQKSQTKTREKKANPSVQPPNDPANRNRAE